VITAREMHKAVMARAKQADVFISVAAVADYHPVDPKPHKIKRATAISLGARPEPRHPREVAALPKGPSASVLQRRPKTSSKRAGEAEEKRNPAPRREPSRTRLSARTPTPLTLFDDNGLHELARAPRSCWRAAGSAHREDAATALAAFRLKTLDEKILDPRLRVRSAVFHSRGGGSRPARVLEKPFKLARGRRSSFRAARHPPADPGLAAVVLPRSGLGH